MSYVDEIKPLRETINRLNTEIVFKIRERVEVACMIGELKKRHGKPVVDRVREEAVLSQVSGIAEENGLDPAGVKRVFREIVDMCVKAEETME